MTEWCNTATIVVGIGFELGVKGAQKRSTTPKNTGKISEIVVFEGETGYASD